MLERCGYYIITVFGLVFSYRLICLQCGARLVMDIFDVVLQPQPINKVTPGTRHLRIKKPTRLIQHNIPSKNASAASYKLAEASIASWDALTDEFFESLVCSMPDRVEAVINAKGNVRF